MRMNVVVAATPMGPASQETPSTRMARTELTRVFPRSNVQSSMLPRRRMGRIFSAYIRCLRSSPAMMICSCDSSNDMRPRVRPEKSAEPQMSATMSG
eukprot:scaffold285405_cov32-Tisochrysis_lutea.AAC.4